MLYATSLHPPVYTPVAVTTLQGAACSSRAVTIDTHQRRSIGSILGFSFLLKSTCRHVDCRGHGSNHQPSKQGTDDSRPTSEPFTSTVLDHWMRPRRDASVLVSTLRNHLSPVYKAVLRSLLRKVKTHSPLAACDCTITCGPG